MKTLLALTFALSFVSVHSQVTKPLFVIDGIAVEPGMEILDKLSVDQIESLTTYNSVEAISKFGEFLGSNGMVVIKTKFDVNRLVDIPEASRLTYGDKKPVVLLNDKIIDYDKINELTTESFFTIQVSRNIDFINKYGLQSINGVVTITTK